MRYLGASALSHRIGLGNGESCQDSSGHWGVMRGTDCDTTPVRPINWTAEDVVVLGGTAVAGGVIGYKLAGVVGATAGVAAAPIVLFFALLARSTASGGPLP